MKDINKLNMLHFVAISESNRGLNKKPTIKKKFAHWGKYRFTFSYSTGISVFALNLWFGFPEESLNQIKSDLTYYPMQEHIYWNFYSLQSKGTKIRSQTIHNWITASKEGHTVWWLYIQKLIEKTFKSH